MTPALTLDEFTTALREAFPDAEVKNSRTHNERWRQCHAATLALYEHEFGVSYNLNPCDVNKRWGADWADGGPVATAAGLRALVASAARFRAKSASDDARTLTDKAGKLKVAALRIEVGP